MRAGEAVREPSARDAPMFVFVIDVASRKAKKQPNTATVERNPYLRLEPNTFDGRNSGEGALSQKERSKELHPPQVGSALLDRHCARMSVITLYGVGSSKQAGDGGKRERRRPRRGDIEVTTRSHGLLISIWVSERQLRTVPTCEERGKSSGFRG